MMAAMSSAGESVDRIERWLARHAPDTLARWQPPAARAEIAAVEEAVGMAFPSALVDLLLRHNGMDDAGVPAIATEFLPRYTAPMAVRYIGGGNLNLIDVLKQFGTDFDDNPMVGTGLALGCRPVIDDHGFVTRVLDTTPVPDQDDPRGTART